MHKKNILVLIILSLVLYFTACDANLDYKNISGDIRLQPSIVVPIGSASVSVAQILSLDTAIHIDTTSFDVFSISAPQSQFVYIDTIANFFLPLATTIDSLKEAQFTHAELNLNISNGFPVNAQLQLIPLDTLGNPISTSFTTNYSIAGGKIDSNGIVNPGNETSQLFQVTLNNSQLHDMQKAHNLAYKLEINLQTVNSKMYFTKSELFSFQAVFFASAIVNTTFKK